MKLRTYQKAQISEIVAHLNNPNSGVRAQVYAPTGSGKTIVFLDIINRLRKTLKIDRPLNIAIAHPRIALSQDQLTRFKGTFGTQFRATSFHSGAHVRGEEEIRERSVLRRSELIEIIDNAGDHATFTSYDSLPKITDIEFDLLICDEAHNMVPSPNDETNITPKVDTLRNLRAKRILFFTATPINDESEECEGMNNPDMFGPIISEVTPAPLITKGYIVGPLIQTQRVTTDRTGAAGVDTTEIVAAAFIKQRETMAKHGLGTIQMLVCSRGYADHKKLEDELQLLWESVGREVDLVVVEAAEARCNGIRLNDRYEALQLISENGKNGKPTIVVHWDTLAEGIDIGTLTGICLLRRMKKTKLLQTIGRAGRPHPVDLDANGEVINMAKRLKPHSILTLPVVDGEHIGGLTAADIAEAWIIGGYGDLVDFVDRDGTTDPTPRQTPEDDEVEEVDPFYSKALEFKYRDEARRLVDLGLVFSF